MNNKILALKYRPRFFDDVVGQEFCVQSLSNSINLNKLHNAYLFSGTRGVGKTTIARIFAKSLLCKEGISAIPCGKCDSCLGIDNTNNLEFGKRAAMESEIKNITRNATKCPDKKYNPMAPFNNEKTPLTWTEKRF